MDVECRRSVLLNSIGVDFARLHRLADRNRGGVVCSKISRPGSEVVMKFDHVTAHILAYIVLVTSRGTNRHIFALLHRFADRHRGRDDDRPRNPRVHRFSDISGGGPPRFPTLTPFC